MILTNGVDDLRDDRWWHLETLQGLAEAVGQNLLLEAGQVAFATISGAAVVDILLLLNVAGEHAVVVGAGHETAKRYLALRVLRPVVASQHLLNPGECLRVDEERMGTAPGFAGPVEPADVELVLEDEIDVAAAHCLAEVALQHLPQAGGRMLTGGVQLHHPIHHDRIDGVDFDRPFALVVSVSKGSMSREPALGSLLAHSLTDLLAKIVGVVLGHNEVDAVYKLCLRLRLLRDHLVLFHQMDRNLKLFKSDRVAKVAIEPVCLLHDQRPAGAVSL